MSDSKNMQMYQNPRVSVSRERRINLERFNPRLKYESESIFVSVQADIQDNAQETMEELLRQTDEKLKEEESRIEAEYGDS